MTQKESKNIMLQDEFFDSIVSERARLFCSSAVSHLQVERNVRELPESRAGHVVLLTMDVMHKCMGWLNERMVLVGRPEKRVDIPGMYRFLAVLIFAHCTGFSFEKSIEILEALDGTAPKLDEVLFISNNILGYSATGRGNDGQSTWLSQRDLTPLLSDFEKVAFEVSLKIFFQPHFQMATLQDDLYGTRAQDNQVKTLRVRKADREGHQADVFADALFRMTLAPRFRRRGEKESQNVGKFLGGILDGRGEQSLTGFIITADRGYETYALLKEVLKDGISFCHATAHHKVPSICWFVIP